jgi:TRAP transporter TAXI family solute receptor
MKKKLLVAMLALSLVAFLCAVNASTALAAKKFVSIASGWVVGVYYPLAGAISNIAHKNLPDIKITVESSGASVANAKLIASGDADMAILQNDISFYALQGVKPMFDKPVANIRGITSLYQEHCQIQARKDAKIASVTDLKGKRVCVGPLGSGTEQNAIQILEAYGMKFDDFAKVERLTATESSDYIKDGRIDAAFYSVGVGAAGLVDTAMTVECVIVPVDGVARDALMKKYPFFTKAVVPKGAYKGIEADVPTVAVMAILVAQAEMEEAMAYQITKAIFDNLKDIERAHAKGKELTLETALTGMSVPLHPGAEKFYKEKGIVK